LIEESLSDLENEFGQRFVRVHRNALIDPKRLTGLQNSEDGQWQLTFKDIDEVIDVSRRNIAGVRAMLRDTA